MVMQVFNVKGMSCGHCVRAIETAIKAVDENADIDVELKLGKVKVQSELPPNEIINAINAEGYEAVLAS